MLHVFRESFGRYVAIAILALIGVTFVFFGIDFSITATSYAAKVNGERIPISLFEEELLARQNQFQQANRVELSDEIRLFLREQVIDTLVLRESMLQKAREEGYRVSEARLENAIRSEPAFQVNGRYSEDVARSLLTSRGMTPSGYKANLRQQLQLQELENAVMDSAFITPAEFRRSIELIYERRQLGWAQFLAADFTEQVEITDDEIAAYHAANAAAFVSEEAVELEYVEVDLASIAETVEVSEQDLLDYYAAESETYAGSEERYVRHIQFSIDDDPAAALAEAESTLARLEAGEDFAALASEVSDDAGTAGSGGDLGWMTRGVLTGPFEDTLFAMEVGALAGPVETAFGYHLLRLDEIRLSEQPPFELERERIRDALAEEEAYTEFLERVDQLDDAAYDAIDDLASVAEAMGLELKRVERLTRSNVAEHFLNPAAVAALAFDDDAIVSGDNSELVQFGEDTVGVIRVAAHFPPEPEPLAAVADEIRQMLTFDAAGELAAAAAQAFSDAIDPDAVVAGTQDPAELAATHGGVWNEPVWVGRAESGVVPNAILSRVLSEPRPAAGTISSLRVQVGSYDEAVVLLMAAEPGVPADIPTEERELGQQELIRQLAQAEFQSFANDTRQRAKVQVPDSVLNPDL